MRFDSHNDHVAGGARPRWRGREDVKVIQESRQSLSALELRRGLLMLARARRAAPTKKGMGEGIHRHAHNLRLAGCPGNTPRHPTSNTSRAARKTAARTAAALAPRPARL